MWSPHTVIFLSPALNTIGARIVDHGNSYVDRLLHQAWGMRLEHWGIRQEWRGVHGQTTGWMAGHTTQGDNKQVQPKTKLSAGTTLISVWGFRCSQSVRPLRCLIHFKTSQSEKANMTKYWPCSKAILRGQVVNLTFPVRRTQIQFPAGSIWGGSSQKVSEQFSICCRHFLF